MHYEYYYTNGYIIKLFDFRDALYKLKEKTLIEALLLISEKYGKKNARAYFSHLCSQNSISCFLYRKEELIGIANIKKHHSLNKVLLLEYLVFVLKSDCIVGEAKAGQLIQYTIFKNYIYSEYINYNRIYVLSNIDSLDKLKLFNDGIFDRRNLSCNIQEGLKGDLELALNLNLVVKKIKENQYIDNWKIKDYADAGNPIPEAHKDVGTILLFAELNFNKAKPGKGLDDTFQLIEQKKIDNAYDDTFLPSRIHVSSKNSSFDIGIIDSGINKELFRKQIIDGVYICFDNKKNKTIVSKGVSDHIGHGSYMANIIKNVVGPDVRFCIAKVVGTGPSNNQALCLIEGIEWAIKRKVKLINVSATINNCSKHLHKLESVCNEAKRKNIIIVCSIDPFTNGESYPFAFDSTIGIGLTPYEGVLFFDPAQNILRLSTKHLSRESSSSNTAYATGLLYNLLKAKPELGNFQRLVSYLTKMCILPNDQFWFK
jgi:hypothetical protein